MTLIEDIKWESFYYKVFLNSCKINSITIKLRSENWLAAWINGFNKDSHQLGLFMYCHDARIFCNSFGLYSKNLPFWIRYKFLKQFPILLWMEQMKLRNYIKHIFISKLHCQLTDSCNIWSTNLDYSES